MSPDVPPKISEADRAAMNAKMSLVSILASTAAGVSMIIGFVLFLISHTALPTVSDFDEIPAPTLQQLLSRAEYRTASAYLGLGLLILALTPILRIIVALTYFWRERNFRYVLVACSVLAILLISFVLAWR